MKTRGLFAGFFSTLAFVVIVLALLFAIFTLISYLGRPGRRLRPAGEGAQGEPPRCPRSSPGALPPGLNGKALAWPDSSIVTSTTGSARSGSSPSSSS